jgi:hypothetical protein
MIKFRQYIKKRMQEQNTVGKHNDGATSSNVGSYIGSDWSGSEQSSTMGYLGHPVHLPSLDLVANIPNLLGLPVVKRSSKIILIKKNENPISLHLADGTKIHMTFDEFNRIKGLPPEVGRNVTVIFQKSKKDKSKELSKIQDIHCH